MTSATDHDIKPESFIFRELATPVDKKKTIRRRRDPRNARSINSQPTLRTHVDIDLIQQEDNDPVSSAQRATILSNVLVYIDKALYNDTRIGPMATSLGATVADTLNSSVTHVIHGSMWQSQHQQQQHQQQQSAFGSNNVNNANKQRLPRLVMQALDRGMRVVSPTWIFECYEQKQRLPEHFYPYNMDTACRLSYQQRTSRHHQQDHRMDRNDNVFGLPRDELGSSSDTDDDKTDDGRVETTGQSNTKEEHDPGEGFNTPRDAISSAMSSTPSSTAAAVATSSAEEMARLEMRMKRAAEIAKLKEQRKRQRQQQLGNDHEVDNYDGLGQHSQPLPGEPILRPAQFAGKERVDIWYGEQSFYDDPAGIATSSRRAGQQRSSKNKGKQ